jgi:hypothetical protein
VSTFGDMTAADAHDVEPPDPEACARILWAALRASAPKRFRDFDTHTRPEREAIIDAVAQLLKRLREEGP